MVVKFVPKLGNCDVKVIKYSHVGSNHNKSSDFKSLFSHAALAQLDNSSKTNEVIVFATKVKVFPDFLAFPYSRKKMAKLLRSGPKIQFFRLRETFGLKKFRRRSFKVLSLVQFSQFTRAIIDFDLIEFYL